MYYNPFEEVPVLAHIQTDKPVYKGNDVMFIEVYFVDPITKKPLLRENTFEANLKIFDSFDQEVFSSSENAKSTNGTIVFTYKVPQQIVGGIYQI